MHKLNDLAVRYSKGFSGPSKLTLADIFRPSPCARGQHPTAGQQPSVPQSATGLWFRLLAMAADRHNGRMDSYRIVPGHRVYRVEAVDANGNIRIVGTWPTEDAAISHLKTLQDESQLPVDPARRRSNETGAPDTPKRAPGSSPGSCGGWNSKPQQENQNTPEPPNKAISDLFRHRGCQILFTWRRCPGMEIKVGDKVKLRSGDDRDLLVGARPSGCR